jgi:hypothetical protein
MIASTTNNQTADVLAGMFTENTGRHMLDSGNAYGRAWERNAGMTTADFLSRPAVQYDAEFQCVEVDLFHYLNERLTFEPELTKGWADFDAERPNDSWGETLDEWLDALGVAPEGGDFYSGARWGFNTYNFDNRLNGTIRGLFSESVLSRMLRFRFMEVATCEVDTRRSKFSVETLSPC